MQMFLFPRCHPFERLRLRNLTDATDCMEVCTNRTVVTSKINNPLPNGMVYLLRVDNTNPLLQNVCKPAQTIH